MLVVSNTSPLTNLAAIGQFALLRPLFEEIHLAEGVWEELNAGGYPYPGSREVESAEWAHIHSVGNLPLVRALCRDLDRGEAETLALAVELEAGVVLLDEREGRRAALRLGLKPLGVLGILLKCRTAGLIEHLRPVLDALRYEAGFYISDPLYLRVLHEAGEETR